MQACVPRHDVTVGHPQRQLPLHAVSLDHGLWGGLGDTRTAVTNSLLRRSCPAARRWKEAVAEHWRHRLRSVEGEERSRGFL